MTRAMVNKKFCNAVLATIGIIVFVLVLEVASRLEDSFRWDANFWNNYSSDMLRCVDNYGVHNRFGAKYEKWQINSCGFRNREIDKKAPIGVQRIMCLGASETFGLYERKNKEYPAQLQTILDNKLPGQFQVINAASYGTSVARATQHYQLWLGQFKPDLVILYPSPAFYLDDSPPSKLLPKSVNTKEQFQSRLLGKIRLVLKKVVPRYIQNCIRQLTINRQVHKHPNDWVWYKPPLDRLELYRSHLAEFIDVVRASGGTPVLITHIHRFNVTMTEEDRYHLTNWRSFYPRADECCLIAMEYAANAIIREVGNGYSVPVIDLDKAMSKKPEYFVDFVHFTDSGAKRIAEELSNRILTGM